MASYHLSAQAGADLNEIAAYIAAADPQAAFELILRFEDRFELLALHPKAGRERDELAPLLRSFPEGRYSIFYRETPGGVVIVRVLHGARDIERRFFAG